MKQSSSAESANHARHARACPACAFLCPHNWYAAEAVRSVYSEEAVAHTVSAIMRPVRKSSAQIKRGVRGFFANRIQHAMMSEAVEREQKRYQVVLTKAMQVLRVADGTTSENTN
jgi:3-hydroxyacyl-CoA dehydrogenase